jgi:hypothetical protein
MLSCCGHFYVGMNVLGPLPAAKPVRPSIVLITLPWRANLGPMRTLARELYARELPVTLVVPSVRERAVRWDRRWSRVHPPFHRACHVTLSR